MKSYRVSTDKGPHVVQADALMMQDGYLTLLRLREDGEHGFIYSAFAPGAWTNVELVLDGSETRQ